MRYVPWVARRALSFRAFSFLSPVICLAVTGLSLPLLIRLTTVEAAGAFRGAGAELLGVLAELAALAELTTPAISAMLASSMRIFFIITPYMLGSFRWAAVVV